MKVMNAIETIREKAEFLVDNLVNTELESTRKITTGFTQWYNENPDICLDRSGVPNRDGAIYIYVATMIGKKDVEDLTGYQIWKLVYSSKYLAFIVEQIHMGLSEYKQQMFARDFKIANMIKLNRALGKHLTEEMTATDIRVNEGGDGVEVTANVDGRKFYTFGTLCGGDIQRLHYRYRSNLK
jgi:hypothetical protein